MNIKLTIAALALLCVGLIGGAVIIHISLQPQLDKAVGEVNEVRRENAVFKKEAELVKGKLEEFIVQEARMRAEISELSADLDMAMSVAEAVTEISLSAEENADVQDHAAQSEEHVGANSRKPRKPMTDEERARIKELQARAVERQRENLWNFVDDRVEKTSDQRAKTRLQNMAEYLDANIEMRTELRITENEADRKALIEAMDANMGEIHSLIKQQQGFMLMELAERSGIDNLQDQQRFARMAMQTLQDPFFHSAPGLASGRVPVPHGDAGLIRRDAP